MKNNFAQKTERTFGSTKRMAFLLAVCVQSTFAACGKETPGRVVIGRLVKDNGGKPTTDGNALKKTGTASNPAGDKALVEKALSKAMGGANNFPLPISSLTCSPDATTPVRVRRLTQAQYQKSVANLFPNLPAGFVLVPLPPDRSAMGFENSAIANAADADTVEIAYNNAKNIATATVTNRFSDLFSAGCAAAEAGSAACRENFLRTTGRRVLRKPLSTAELQKWGAFVADGITKFGVNGGYELALAAMLQSPGFLYVTELGELTATKASQLTQHELASVFSYLITDAPPDALLAKAADDKQLDSATLMQHAKRLLESDAGKATLKNFLSQLFELQSISTLQKDPKAFASFDGTMTRDLRKSAEASLDDMLSAGKGNMKLLLTSKSAFVNDKTAPLFNVTSQGAEFKKVEFTDSTRSGLLTHPAILALHSIDDQSAPVHRGVFVRRKILCQNLPSPPAGLEITAPPVNPKMTTRERWNTLTSQPSCTGCHQLINPIGFGFEAYDGLGRHRTVENGHAVNASGTLSQVQGVEAEFSGGVELSSRLAGSVAFQECMGASAFRFVVGRQEQTEDACGLQGALKEFVATDTDIRSLFLALLKAQALATRKMQ